MIQNRFGTIFGEGEDPFVNNEEQGMITNAYTVRTDMMRMALHKRTDINKECDYPETAQIKIIDYKEMYDRSAIGNRVVSVLPAESWQVSPEIFEDDDPDTETEFEKAWADLGRFLLEEESFFENEDEKGNPIWEYLHRADRLSGIGHFGIILIGIDDGKPLHEAVDGFEDPEVGDLKGPMFVNNKVASDPKDDKKEGGKGTKRNLLYLSVFDESCITSMVYEPNQSSPRYRKPKFYNIDLGINDTTEYTAAGREGRSIKVHWSRCIHIVDNMDSSEVFGVPRQRSVWNHLLDLMKVYGGGAEGFWKNCVMRIFLETHPQLGGDVTIDEEGIKEKMWDMDNGLQKHAALMGMSAKTVAPTVVDPSPHVNTQIEAICIKIPIPKRVFMGSERGELASGQDDGTWNDTVRGRRNEYVIPRIIAPFVNRLIKMKVLPTPKSLTANWPDPETMKPLEKAQLALTRADTMAHYIAGKVDMLIDPMDFLTREMGFSDDEADTILERAVERAEGVAEEQEAERVKLAGEQEAANEKLAKAQPAPVVAPGAPSPDGKPGFPPKAKADGKPGFPPKAKAAPKPAAGVAKPPKAAAKAPAPKVKNEMNTESEQTLNALSLLHGGGHSKKANAKRAAAKGGKMLDKPSSAFKSLNPDGKDTEQKFMDKDGNYTPERVKLHDEIVAKIIATATPVDDPVSYIMGGGPAAGKSSSIRSGQVSPPKNSVMIAGDELKAELPEYKEMFAKKNMGAASMVHEESSHLSKRIQKEASLAGYNTLLDGTGDSSVKKLREKTDLMRAKGQKVVGVYATVSTETAVKRNVARAKVEGRIVPEAAVRASHAGVSRTVPEAIKQGIYDEFTLFDTNGKSPRKVASAKGTNLTVHEPKLWQDFLDKGTE